MKEETAAQVLGWFSIGLGLTETLATEGLTRYLGMERSAGLVRLFGLREIAAGVGLLTRPQPAPWLWARVGGDVLDLAALGSAMSADNPQRRRVGSALAVVAAITMLDIAAAQRVGQDRAEGGGPPSKREAARTGTALSYVRYSDGVEVVPDDEYDTITKIIDSMHRLGDRTEKKYGHAVRTSHAKSHGAAVGELAVLDGLPEPLRQGLFAAPGRYPVVARLANIPGEIVSDAVTTQAGLAFKVLGVEGEMLPGHDGEHTQDFVLDMGSRFGPANAKEFLATHLGLEHMPQVPETVKKAGTKTALAANTALHAVGGDSATTCSACVSLMARESRFHPQMCGLCAEVCRACAAECERHDEEHCRACADACRRCADECGRMAAMTA